MTIIIKDLQSKLDSGYFAMQCGECWVFFEFDNFNLFKASITKENRDNTLQKLANEALAENAGKITKDCYFEFVAGRFEFLNYVPDWAKDIYE